MGGVSWNVYHKTGHKMSIRRRPYGWCELKWCHTRLMSKPVWSPPLWVVWVEISVQRDYFNWFFVAALMGGVSWNRRAAKELHISDVSPPLWVAWVEMSMTLSTVNLIIVAILMGGVSWNVIYRDWQFTFNSRHPYGWRELKWLSCLCCACWCGRRPYGRQRYRLFFLQLCIIL